MIKHFRKILPFLIFLLMIVFLWRGLSLHPAEIPSPLINKPAPLFELPNLLNPKKLTSNKDFIGHVTLVNVWATWCVACVEEHALLLQIAQHENIFLYGLNYKDDPNTARNWLIKHGNPYQIIAEDRIGTAAIDWGVYGTPETFILDKKGVIRYKKIGRMTPDDFQENIKPLLEILQKESP